MAIFFGRECRDSPAASANARAGAPSTTPAAVDWARALTNSRRVQDLGSVFISGASGQYPRSAGLRPGAATTDSNAPGRRPALRCVGRLGGFGGTVLMRPFISECIEFTFDFELSRFRFELLAFANPKT